ncbi:PHP domain-containing protein [Persicimonas caeni]|nr:PHP domain-containing protein [Persicimonas caeni]
MSTSSANKTHRAEIHSHSTASDGAYAPSRVAELCHQRGVEVWSLTDHDNCNGCTEAREAAESLGITFISGIEISAYHDTSVHVLGYGVDTEGDVIQDYSERRFESRRERMRQMIARLDDLGVDISFEAVADIAQDAIMGRPHLARALVAAGEVGSVNEAFDRYLHTGGPAHVSMGWPSVENAIDLIHRAGGIAILAHPGQYDLDDDIGDWIDAGLDGIEAIHPQHNRQARRRYAKMARGFGVLSTASSDFHGNRDRFAHFGNVPFPVNWLDAFLERLGVS